MLVLTIAIGLDRASLNFGGSAAAGQQQTSGVTVQLKQAMERPRERAASLAR